VVLAVLGAAVLLAGVYLFHEVRSTPALAEGSAPPPRATPEPHHDDEAVATAARAPGHVAAPSRPSSPTNGPASASDPPSLAASDDAEVNERANPSLDAIMDRANKAYDHQEWDEAKAIAGKVLAKQPNNVRMLRILVSIACIESDVASAQKNFEQLPKPDRDQMKLRCDKQYGVALKEPAQ